MANYSVGWSESLDILETIPRHELKLCPFCGSVAGLYAIRGEFCDKPYAVLIQCSKCWLNTTPTRLWRQKEPNLDLQEAIHQTVAMWNTRVKDE